MPISMLIKPSSKTRPSPAGPKKRKETSKVEVWNAWFGELSYRSMRPASNGLQHWSGLSGCSNKMAFPTNRKFGKQVPKKITMGMGWLWLWDILGHSGAIGLEPAWKPCLWFVLLVQRHCKTHLGKCWTKTAHQTVLGVPIISGPQVAWKPHERLKIGSPNLLVVGLSSSYPTNPPTIPACCPTWKPWNWEWFT